MFSLVLAEVSGHAAEATGEAASGLTKITQDFGLSLPNILAQILSFSVVAFVLYKYGFKPVLATLSERQNRIESGLKYAEDMKAQLAASQQETATLIKNAQVESNKIIEEARKTAKDFADKIQKEAAERATRKCSPNPAAKSRASSSPRPNASSPRNSPRPTAPVTTRLRPAS